MFKSLLLKNKKTLDNLISFKTLISKSRNDINIKIDENMDKLKNIKMVIENFK